MDQQLDETPEKTIKQNTDRFSCPACGGNMIFDPESQSLTCPYCDKKTDIVKQQGDIKEYDFKMTADDAPNNWENESRVMRCESCGAQTVLDENNTAQFCPFCGSSHIVKQDEQSGIIPESLIPFKVTKEKSLGHFREWIKKRYFAPNALKKEYNDQKLNGVYIPCWTYDSSTYSTYSAEAGTYYYETVTDWVEENGQRKMVTRQERRVSWHYVTGDYSEFFNDILVNASGQIDEALMGKLEPFHFEELVHYKPEFLSGFLAEHYSIDINQGWATGRTIIEGQICEAIRSQINADEVRNLTVNTSHDNIKYKHILLPIWISAYTYKGKVYRYMVNGQTGEVQGHAPISAVKITLMVIAALAIIGLIWLIFRKN